ncbi:ATP-binding cassette domain-containing protein [Thermodesulfobacteriota bacterium]
MNHSTFDITAENAEPSSASPASPLSCKIKASTLTCIVGENHPLNISFMRMLAGLDKPRLGRVLLFGENLNEMDEQLRRDLRLKIGFVDVEAHLLSVLSGYDNLKMPAHYHGVGSHEEIEERAERLIADIDYDANHDVIPAYMTGLQKRHLTIARALMLKPSVLFLDNPLDGLDHFARQLITGYLIKVLKQRGMAIVTCNTDIIFVNENADKIIFIGMEKTLTFDNWEGFTSSKNNDVIKFLGREKIILRVDYL